MSSVSSWKKRIKDTSFKNTVSTIIIVLLTTYSLIGAFPIVPQETDGMGIALGIQSKVLYGNYIYAYGYTRQPGTYKLIEFLGAITKLDYFCLFSLLSLIACAIFMVFSVIFIKKITKNNISLISIASLLLLQETVVSGYYPNTSILAAAFLVVSLSIVVWTDGYFYTILAGVLFAISFWVRFDAILIGAVFLVLLYSPNLHDTRANIKLLLFFSIAALFGVFLFNFSNVALSDIFTAYSTHVKKEFDLMWTLRIYSSIFSVAMVFFLSIGLYEIFHQKEWRLLLLIVCGTFPLFAAYGFGVTTPKYLLYTLVFIAIPISYALMLLTKSDKRKSERILFIGILFFFSQYIFTPPYELILNRSTIIQTDDGQRLRGAIAFTPFFSVREKWNLSRKDSIYQENLRELIQKEKNICIISQDWMANYWVLYYLHKDGYRIKETDNFAAILEYGQYLILEKGEHAVTLVRWQPESVLDLPMQWQNRIQNFSLVLYVGPEYQITTTAQESFLEKEFEWQLLPEWERFETILFSHK